MPKKADSINQMQVVRDTDEMAINLSVIERATEKVIRTDTYKWNDVHKSCRKFVSLYGMLSILRDRNSGVPLVMDKLDAYQDTWNETLSIGNLKKDRQAQGKRLTDLQAEVLAKYFSKKSEKTVSLGDVREGWSDLSEDQKVAILAAPAVVEMITAAAKLPSIAEGVTFDDFLGKK